MVEIYDITTGNVFKIRNARSTFKRKDFIQTYTKVGRKFLENHKGMFQNAIDNGLYTELTLNNRYRVKGVDKEEESMFMKIFEWFKDCKNNL